MSVRHRVLQALIRGDLDEASSIEDVPAIGPYLASRIARAIDRPTATIGQLRAALRRRTTTNVERFLARALQNERSNQCVSPTIQGNTIYHTGDVNERGYEALAAILNHARTLQNVRYEFLPHRLPRRSQGSKTCGCRGIDQCNGPCILTTDGACVPRAHNARGFSGSLPHPSQREQATTDAARRSVRNRARTRVTQVLQNDPDSARDLVAGHPRSMRYSQRGNTLWRRPSPKVRLTTRV